MRLRSAVATVLFASALASAAACGEGPSPPPPPDNPGTGEMITGRERIGWTQRAQDAAELATFDYAIYVDAARRVLTGETCTASGGAFACSAPLPTLTGGSHTLALAAFVTIDGAVLESARSASLQVTVTAAASPADVEIAADEVIPGPDGSRLYASVVARNLDDPSDLAIAPDGRAFVAQAAGEIKVVTEDILPEDPDPRAQPGSDSLESIALHPDFARTRVVFAIYRAPDEFRLVRLRELGGAFGEAATIRVFRTDTRRAAAVLRVGPDRRLYLALGAGTDPRAPQDPASFLGKILRLNQDGSTPPDNSAASLLISSGHREPRGLTWDPQTLAMWSVEADDAGDELNAIAAGHNYGWPIARGSGSYPGATPATFTWDAGTDVGGAAYVPAASAAPFAGALLVAARGAQDLFRITIGQGGAVSAIDRVLGGRFGRIGHVAVGPNAIYITTANRDLWGAGHDLLIRVHAEER